MNMTIKHALGDRRVQGAVALAASVAAVGLGWFLYNSYRARINEQAQFSFALQLENLEKLRQDPAADKQMWESAERDFAQASQEHSASDLAAFYLASQAEAAWQAQKLDEAIAAMEKAVAQLGSSNPLFYLYATKLQVMRLASPDVKQREVGKQELYSLANNAHNPSRGYAWYQLWHHAWVAGDHTAAEEALAKLAASQSQDAQWSKLAQAKMDFSA